MFISDKTYHQISDDAYDKDTTKENSEIGDWSRVNLPNSTLNDTNASGFDAVVYYNKEDDQVIIGYRGTEPDMSWGKVTDIETDAFDVIGGRYKRAKEMLNPLPVLLDHVTAQVTYSQSKSWRRLQQ